MAGKLLPDPFPGITTGNAIEDGRAFNHWFVGDLSNWSEGQEPVSGQNFLGLRDTHSIEVKWGIHGKGESRASGWAPPSDWLTLSVLMRGRFSLRFRRPSDRGLEGEHVLAEEGDYAIWDELIEHTWTAEEDSVVLTVRWRAAP